jgi:hypothetical protein
MEPVANACGGIDRQPEPYDESTNPSNGWRAPEPTDEQIDQATEAGYDELASGWVG